MHGLTRGRCCQEEEKRAWHAEFLKRTREEHLDAPIGFVNLEASGRVKPADLGKQGVSGGSGHRAKERPDSGRIDRGDVEHISKLSSLPEKIRGSGRSKRESLHHGIRARDCSPRLPKKGATEASRGRCNTACL